MAELDLGSVVGPQGQQGIQGQTGPQGPAGPGVPSGGTDGQFLLKDGSTNYAAKWGTVTGADLDVSGVDSTKISAALTSTNQAIANVQNGLAYIVGNTNTTGSTLTVGQFVYVKGHSTIAEGLRVVTASISAGGNITTSNTSECSGGGLNALNGKVIKIAGWTTPNTTTGEITGGTIPSGYAVIQVTCYTSGQDRSIPFGQSSTAVYAIGLPSENYYNKSAVVYAMKI